MDVIIMASRATTLKPYFRGLKAKTRFQMRFNKHFLHNRLSKQRLCHHSRSFRINLCGGKQRLKPVKIPPKPTVDAATWLRFVGRRSLIGPIAYW
jgi:hypothetical protein